MIAVIGAAGTIGRNVARFLEAWGAPLVRRDARLEGEERVDASDARAVGEALAGCSVCVNCVDYRLNPAVMRGALDAGAHYVDLGGLYHVTRLQLEMDAEFRERGLGALLGMGSAPGKTNLLASAAVSRLGEEPRALEIWAATRDPAAEGHPFPAPYSVRTLLDELSMAPVIVEDGEVVEVEPLSGRATRRLAEPVGPATGIYTLHSELATLPSAFPTLEQVSFRLCLSPGLLEKLLALGEDEEPEPYEQSDASVAVHLVDVAADSGRRVVGWTLTRGGSARSTSEPAARAAVELLEGRMELVGAKAPEAAIPDAEAFLALLDTEVYWEVA
jgi:saccharopine dehydrogenase-like NADP-dependent oxidoreductase